MLTLLKNRAIGVEQGFKSAEHPFTSKPRFRLRQCGFQTGPRKNFLLAPALI